MKQLSTILWAIVFVGLVIAAVVNLAGAIQVALGIFLLLVCGRLYEVWYKQRSSTQHRPGERS